MKIDVPQNPPLATKIVVGELYCGKFAVDDVWYRARIIREIKDKYEVHYIDFGNYEVIGKDRIGLISQELRQVKSQLYRCSLYDITDTTSEAK